MFKGFEYVIMDAPKDDPSAKEIFRGTSNDVCEYIGKSISTVYELSKGKNDHECNGYFIYSRNKKEKGEYLLQAPKKKQKKLSKFEKKVKEYERRFDIYGNTITYSDPKRMLDAFAEDGYLVTSKHEPKRVIRNKSGGIVEVYSECWILELKNKIDISKENLS